MIIHVTYKGSQRTTCLHEGSQSVIETDAPKDNNGKGERFSPTDLFATSFASCILTIMSMKAESMDINLEGLEIKVQKEMASDPRRISEINLSFSIPKHLVNIDKKNINILKNVSKTCPVAKSIHPDIIVSIDWQEWS